MKTRALVSLVLLVACGGPAAPAEHARAVDLAPAPLPAPPSSSAAPASPASPPPSSRLPALARGWPALPRSFDALVVRGATGRATLLDASSGVRPAVFYLLPPGGLARLVRLADGSVLDDPHARALGIQGPAALVHVEIAGRPASACDARSACVARITRLDATPAIPIDVGATLTKLVAGYAITEPAGRELAEHARRAGAAVARSAPPRPPSFGYAPHWSAADGALRVLVVARVERDVEVRTRNPDPKAGTFGCDAPPGADCAPHCIPPDVVEQRAVIGEAGVEIAFLRDGSPASVTDAGQGTLPPRVRHMTPSGTCGGGY